MKSSVLAQPKPCRRRNSLPAADDISCEGPPQNAPSFCGECRSSWRRAAYRPGGSAGGVIFPPQRKIYKRWPGGHLLACQKSLAEFAARRRQRNEIIFSRDMCVRENTARAASVEFVRYRRTNYARSRPQAFCRKNPEGFSTVSVPRSCDLGTPCVKKSVYRKNLFAGPLSSTGSIPDLYTRTGPPGAGPQ